MSDKADPTTQSPESEGQATELRHSNQTNDTNSSASYDSEEDDMAHSLGASTTTIGVSNLTASGSGKDNNKRERSSSRRSKKGERRCKGKSGLRTKFQIESLRLQITDLKNENELLKRLLAEAQQKSSTSRQRSSSSEVPSTVQLSDTSITEESDLDSSDRRGPGFIKSNNHRRFNSSLDSTEFKEEDEMNMEFNRLSCAWKKLEEDLWSTHNDYFKR